MSRKPTEQLQYIYSITEIADLLGVSQQYVDGKMNKVFNWQPTGERVQGGGATYNIDQIRFHKNDSKDAAARKKIKDKICNAAHLRRMEALRTAFAEKIAAIKQQQELSEKEVSEELPLSADDSNDLWKLASNKSEEQQNKALKRSEAVEKVKTLMFGGMGKLEAMHTVSAETGFHWQSINNWMRKTVSVSSDDAPAVLLNRREGGNRGPADCTPEAWEYFKIDFLRKGKGGQPPSIASCYRRLETKAAEKGWTVPVVRTLSNWIKHKLDPMVVMLMRYGWDAVEKHYPAMKRTKEMFDVLEAVNGDGFSLGIWADFGNGTICQPIVWTWQDIRGDHSSLYDRIWL